MSAEDGFIVAEPLFSGGRKLTISVDDHRYVAVIESRWIGATHYDVQLWSVQPEASARISEWESVPTWPEAVMAGAILAELTRRRPTASLSAQEAPPHITPEESPEMYQTKACENGHTEACAAHNIEKHPNTVWCQDVRPCEDLDHAADLATQ